VGDVEQKAKILRRKNHIQQAILTTLAVSGAVALVALAPALVAAVGMVARQTGGKFTYRARTAAGRLAQKGMVRFVERNGRKWLEITEQGRRSAELEMHKAKMRLRKRRWDRRYRLVIFDIPEERKTVRRHLRLLMRECGFLRVQDSVWLYPHDCEELVTLIKAELRTGKDVLYTVVESIENDKWIKAHFGLS